MKRIILFLCLCLALATVSAQDSTLARVFIKNLASKEFHGRGGAFNGDSIAASYIAEKLSLFGAKPLADDYLQRYSFKTFKMEGDYSISLAGKNLEPCVDFSVHAMSKDFHGKVDILYFDAEKITDPDAVQQFCDKNRKKLPKSFVCIDKGDEKDLNKKALRTINQLKRENIFGVAGYLIGVEAISAMSIPANAQMLDHSLFFVRSEMLAKQPKTAEIKYDSKLVIHRTQNVVAYVPGTERPDSMIVFMAHYDHVGQVGTVVYPGAHDNASGTAAVMDMARHFAHHPAKYTTVFLFFSGEESGLMGSKYFSEHSLIDLYNVKFMVNIDLFCGGDDGIIVFNAEADNTKAVFEKMKQVNEKRGYVKDIEPRKNSANSDHYYFVERGCPAIFILTKGGAYGGYHSPTDTCEGCAINKYNDVWNLIMETLGL